MPRNSYAKQFTLILKFCWCRHRLVHKYVYGDVLAMYSPSFILKYKSIYTQFE